LILRADGAATGFATTEASAFEALVALAEWFVSTGGPAAGRMHRHIETAELPAAFQGERPRAAAPSPEPGGFPQGFLLGAAFGSVDAKALNRVFMQTGAIAMRVTPWRMFFLEGVTSVENSGFVEGPGDPLLAVHACPGAPFCTQAEAETRTLAQALALHLAPDDILHVSGCSKGCAHPRAADVTVVGRDGAFDVVRGGSAWDEPSVTCRSVDAVLREITR
jgi:precorrin-3B synthase